MSEHPPLYWNRVAVIYGAAATAGIGISQLTTWPFLQLVLAVLLGIYAGALTIAIGAYLVAPGRIRLLMNDLETENDDA